MGTSLVRYTSTKSKQPSWGVLKEEKIHALKVKFDHHRDVMDLYHSNRTKFDAAIAKTSISRSDAEFLSPLSQDIQLIAQGMNYESHRAESRVTGAEKEVQDDDQNLLFYKASSTISKPNVTILRPKNTKLLDYEIELGIVMKKAITKATEVTEKNLGDYIGGLILTNDVSSRDEMFGASVLQWYKGKSFRTFCPAGPVLYLLDGDDIKQIYSLQLKLSLNGTVMQDATTDQLLHKPPATLTELSTFTNLNVGDCIITGTPGGVLMNLNVKTALAIVLNLKKDRKRREKLTAAQLAKRAFLKPGDVLELEIKSTDGRINLGRQRNEIAEA